MTDEFFSKHKDDFIKEATILVDRMNSTLLGLEKNPANQGLFHELFRSAHTLKSICATMNYIDMARLCHAIEDVLEAIRGKHIAVHACANILFESFDFLSANVKEIVTNDSELDNDAPIARINQLLSMGEAKEMAKQPDPDQGLQFQAVEKLKFIEVKVDRLDVLMKLSEELLVSRIKLELLREAVNNPELTAAVDTLGRHITNMQYNIMQIRLVPIGFIFNRFPRMVRDIAKQQKKEINLELEGGDIELDRSLIDEIGESLTHLIRNAIDHGVESPEIRLKQGKEAQATLRLSAKRTKEFALIEVQDDGQGLNLETIEKEAIKQNLIFHGASKEEIMNCIFSGISTTKEVTDVSGRGLGLPIIKQKIDSIGGNIRVESEEGTGTKFIIKIPLTLAVINVLFITVGGQIYAIPITSIDRLLTVPAQDIKGLLNYNAIVYGGDDIPITHLSELFKFKSIAMDNYPIIVIRQGEERLGLVADSLLSTQEVVIKPLARVVKETRYFSGSALIGSGEMVLILDVDHLFLTRRKENEWRTINAV